LTQHAYCFENAKYCFVKQTRNNTKILNKNTKLERNYSPPQTQYFVEPPFAAITAASLLGYVSVSLAHLATVIFGPFFKSKLLQLLQVGWVLLVYSNYFL
jgi:hypothetical protein